MTDEIAARKDISGGNRDRMYRNSLRPSTLFGMTWLVFSLTAWMIWGIASFNERTPALDVPGVVVLAIAVTTLFMAILFLRRARRAGILASIVLHLLLLATTAGTIFGLFMGEDATAKMAAFCFGFLGMGLLGIALLVLHGEGMRRDLTQDSSSRIAGEPYRRRWIARVAMCGLGLLLAWAAWRVVPLLLAKPTIAVDYLSEANRLSQPPGYDPNLDAGPLYEKFFAEFKPLPDVLKDKWKSWPTEMDPFSIDALKRWSAANEPALPLLARIAQCPYWCCKMQSSSGALWDFNVPHLAEERLCAWGIVVLAKYKASQGQVSEAVDLLAGLHMMGMHRVQGRLAIEQLLGVALCTLAMDNLLAILDRHEVDAGTLKRLLKVFSSRLPGIDVPRFTETEHLYGLDWIQHTFTDDGHGDGRLIPGRLYEMRKNGPLSLSYAKALRICLNHPGRAATTRLLKESFEATKELAVRTPWQLHGAGTDYETELKKLEAGNSVLNDGSHLEARYIELCWRLKVSQWAGNATLAVLLHKAEQGGLPASLQELVDDGYLEQVPADPFSGGSIVYRATGDYFILYSVGVDLDDNGGVPATWQNIQEGKDRVFWPVHRDPLSQAGE
jgi:hypothetical protein